tara:strand:- start:255 stop:470 length:216 start_codon:yes stop_codon:yes gene_type:complete
MIIENPDGTFGFLPLVRSKGRINATVDHREDTTRETGGGEDSASSVCSRTLGTAQARIDPGTRKGHVKHRF